MGPHASVVLFTQRFRYQQQGLSCSRFSIYLSSYLIFENLLTCCSFIFISSYACNSAYEWQAEHMALKCGFMKDSSDAGKYYHEGGEKGKCSSFTQQSFQVLGSAAA